MDYYERRRQAFNHVGRLLASGASEAAITFDISSKYGLPAKTIKSMITEIVSFTQRGLNEQRKD